MESDADAFAQFLAKDCELVPTRSGDQWQLRESVRRETLHGLGSEEILAAADANKSPIDDPAQRMMRAYARGQAPSLTDQTADDLYGTLRASEWLQGAKLSVPDPDEVRSHLQLAALLDPLRHLVGNHFMGRQDELNQLYDYVEIFPPTSRRVTVTRFVRQVLSLEEKPPLVIHGPGGAGKSTLIAKFLIDHASVDQSLRFPYAYLNCDRSDLSPDEPITFLIEAVRQIGGQYSGIQSQADWLCDSWLRGLVQRRAVAVGSDMTVSTTDTATVAAVEQLAALLHDIERLGRSGTPFLLVFDTFEEVQRRGLPAVEATWRVVELLQPAFPFLRTVFVGRAPVAGHKTLSLGLAEFPPGLAKELLRAELQAAGADVDEELVTWTVKRVGGFPLALRLAAEVLRREGRDGLRDVSRRQFWLKRIDEMQLEGMLYRRILDHIDDPDVRRIASPGLAMRRITPELIRQVLAKPCGLRIEDEAAARRLFEGLKAEAGLVEVAEEGRALYHRPDVRRVMLGMLRQDDAGKFAQIHRRAVAWYVRQPGAIARAEEIYHRLSLGQGTATLDRRWDDAARPYLVGALDDLPAGGQAYLAHKLGLTVSPDVLHQADDETWRRQISRQVTLLIKMGDFEASLELLHQRRGRDGRSLLPLLEAQVLRLMRRLPEAQRIAEAGLNEALAALDRVGAPLLTRLLAEIAEAMNDPVRAITQIHEANMLTDRKADPVGWLAGMVIEYRLSRESSLLGPQQMDELRDEILSVAKRLPPQHFDAHPEVLRDLAAEFASDDLQIATEAVRVLGLATEENRDQAIDLLAPALDVWSQELAQLGKPADVLLESARVEGQGQPAWRAWLRRQPQTEWSSAVQRLLLDYPLATAPIQAALAQVFQLVANPLSKNA